MEKRFVLLTAYEKLTAKETFCIKEANFDEIQKVQSKKTKILVELETLNDQDRLSTEEKMDFNGRLEELQKCERENDERLNMLISQNRTELKSLSKRATSVSRFRKAYGSASSLEPPSGSLTDKA